ncbi:uncharacterized protein LOC130110309 [Lampris incognitus]|uniref:uncharacterized protein LOC130110309 n=1 Tax=Lampris incognitus TaxID=2546036 RepID=UPI0024B569B1|nr:uncharacterized protein LOC130110309 [Lampris incognitus]
MKSSCCLSLILLGCAFGLPVPAVNNHTQQQEDQSVFKVDLMETRVGNSSGNEDLHQKDDRLDSLELYDSYMTSSEVTETSTGFYESGIRMKSSCCLSLILLGCAFGLPVPEVNNHTQQQEDQSMFNVVLMETRVGNSSGNEDLHQRNDTLDSLEFYESITTMIRFMEPLMKVPCPPYCPTCAIATLVHDLQAGGDERAGSAAYDAYGPGK